MKKIFIILFATIISIAAYAGMTDSCGDPANQVVISATKRTVSATGYGVNRNNTVTVLVECENNKTFDISIEIKDGKGSWTTPSGYDVIKNVKITNRYCLIN